MDVTPGITQLSQKLPGMVQALTDAGKADEAILLQSVSDDLTKLTAAESAIVTAALEQFEEILNRQISRLNGATVTLGSAISPYGFTLNVPPAGNIPVPAANTPATATNIPVTANITPTKD